MLTRRNRFLAIALAAALALSGCSRSDSSDDDTPDLPGISVADEDSNDEWDVNATKITLEGSSASVSGSGASFADGVVTITKAGDYILSGTLTDGQILVDAGKDDLVRLVLSGVDITCSDSAGIYARQAGKTVLILPKDSDNQVTDGSSYVYGAGEDEPDAAVFAKDDLSITGTGALTVNGQFNNGVGCKDNLVVTDGTLRITAVNDALRGRDSVTVTGGTFVLDAGGDGIQSNNDTDATKGWIRLGYGGFDITAGGDGIQAETNLSIEGGYFNIVTGGGSGNAPERESADMGRGGFDRQPPDGAAPADLPAPPDENAVQPTSVTVSSTAEPAAADTGATDSFKALKAGVDLNVTGGVFSINAQDDALHSNGNVTISGGELSLSTGDDGVHADDTLTITDGAITISTCYEGLEGATVLMTGGTVDVTADDDGVNAAGGSDGDAGADQFRTGGTNEIRISGGKLTVNAQGDGLDSNGNLYLEGGRVLVYGPSDGANGALDYDGDCILTGGVLAALGGMGMAQSPGENSTQPSLTVFFTETQPEGTTVNLSDADGNTLFTIAPSKPFQSIVLSSPDLTLGKTYTVSTGGSCADLDEDNRYSTEAYTGGAKLLDIALDSMVTRISSDGSAVAAGAMGGRGGGMRPDGTAGGRGGTKPTAPGSEESQASGQTA